MSQEILNRIRSGENKTFCVMPWIGFAGDSDGKYCLCCVDIYSKERIQLGNSKNISIKEYQNSEALKKIRRSLLQGEKIPNCLGCYKKEEAHIKSIRQKENKKYRKNIPNICENTDIKTGVTTFDFIFLHIRFSNICNLACRMC